ncbi:type II CRISPR-associated endonuclease Cas1 [Actinomyces vulturis]|uniref:type II CRISPR-associated endonuclease Cas1 n=1 Tax=Actinomyces vulturis TaxID=1857645 RepID=UPI00082B203B|nr:type II CRISPR-associated endonuclease Cas1 [Actinomyces vulturis]
MRDRGWRIIDCSHLEGEIHSVRGAIRITNQHGTTDVAVEDIAVLLVGPSVSFSSAAIHRLTSAQVSVLFCDWRGVPESACWAWSYHSRVGARANAQAALAMPKRKQAWKSIVRAKIHGQANCLEGLSEPGYRTIRHLASTVRSGDSSNVEAQAARLYWQSLFGDDFRRDPDIPGVNAALNYGYMILRGFAIRAVIAAGLVPALGVFHHGRSNPFNLADDLIEPFRPTIDWVVAQYGDDVSVDDPDVKRSLVAAADAPFLAEGTRVSTAMEFLAQAYGRYVENEVVSLEVPIFRSGK